MVLAVTFGRFARSRSMRVLLHGIGLALIIVALWIVGFLDLVLAWLRATVDWVRTTPLDRTRTIGALVGALGALLVIIGSAISPVSRAEARQRRERRAEGSGPAPAAGRPTTGAGREPAEPKAVDRGTAASERDTAHADDDDAEIEEILRRRGIQ